MCCISLYSYIKPQLQVLILILVMCCISLYSYIKPQHWYSKTSRIFVVYLYIPTSNHNLQNFCRCLDMVVYLYIPTSNHNWLNPRFEVQVLYIFIFLHQTTTRKPYLFMRVRCISLYSYIKPQLAKLLQMLGYGCISLYSYIKPQRIFDWLFLVDVVYLYIPTSNHNCINGEQFIRRVVYLYIPTSNHNRQTMATAQMIVVYLYIPTSNHNKF